MVVVVDLEGLKGLEGRVQVGCLPSGKGLDAERFGVGQGKARFVEFGFRWGGEAFERCYGGHDNDLQMVNDLSGLTGLGDRNMAENKSK